ncbi:MAG: hypothetical protein Q9169_008324, partial [Polycauliona sp. 2 TL-2023]
MAPQTTSTSHTVKHAPWMTATPAGSVSLNGPLATSTAISSAAPSDSRSPLDPVQLDVHDPASDQQSIIRSTPVATPNAKPGGTNVDSGDRSHPPNSNPLPQQLSSTQDDYEFEDRPVYNVNGQKITPGGSAVKIDGVQYSLDASATALMSDSQFIPLNPPTNTIPGLPIGQDTTSANSASIHNVGEQSLSPGGSVITRSGISYSLVDPATVLVVDNSALLQGTHQSEPPPLSINGKIYSADTRPRLKVKGTEIVAGGATVTINDTPYALDPSATAL